MPNLTMRYACLALPFLLIGCSTLAGGGATPSGAEATLALLETTDLHANVLSFDYYKLKDDPSIGIERTATLIKQARAEYPNNLLFDNGDALQGTALADYQALVRPVACGETLAIYKAMNQLKVDGASVGNHEFNYGLAYLSQVTGSHFDVDGVPADAPRCAGPDFPIVLANIYSAKTKQPLFAPYHILTRQIGATGPDGKPLNATIRIGIIGFTPPGILSWDKRWLQGKVYAEGVRETAQKYIPRMRAEGADLIVAVSHGGLSGEPYDPGMEDGNYYLAEVPGVDVLLMGHQHLVFPNPASSNPNFNLPRVDKTRGAVRGVPAVMANLWGKNLGVIGLRLKYDGQHWRIDKARTTVEARSSKQSDGGYVAADPAFASLIAAEHAATIRYVQTPVGSSDFRMTTYFADVGDVSALEPVNQAQTAYVRDYVKANLPQYANLPVLSVTAPFKSGAAGPADYTDVKPGPLALNNAADLYLYPNELHAVKVSGAQLKAWLEKAAERFNRIDPASSARQELVDSAFYGFNFDAPTDADLNYRIDVTQPAGQRIVDLHYKGAALSPSQEFLVATNNYRASGGGNFPGLDGSKTVIASPDASRDVLIAYVRKAGRLTRARNGAARSWRFAPVRVEGQVVFHSAPNMTELARDAGLSGVTQLNEDDGGGKGFALYAIDLSK
ncbi:bifunctional 2',3'-cyclic-nucleotide 2'-phosphodiesterase/3'-nucleotidase [Duganella callida]|uniref:Bifunctional 2',3'-cyclic-nucleotide 2'-phosphodiesterase/3'-nucleotidase n=2 Tax=Duganella callida TaxID=2561932 RepID=A0A4Y9SYS3_9BURK|nr:bifunctional 2',3'-cyclic-nucleotide 2'-phosphodiesterase/3'-nucleotidase [Duganella callida]